MTDHIQLKEIPLREVLHFLGWRGSPLEETVLTPIREMTALAEQSVQPKLVARRFPIAADGCFEGTCFAPQGEDVRRMLEGCREGVLLAATLGAQSERLLLRWQALNGERAVILDAVLSAAVEAVLDQVEEGLRAKLRSQQLYLTDRFSPGYGDMPLAQSPAICDVLSTARTIGLTVGASGIMIPRKSVTAVMGISATPVSRRPAGCEGCAARETCALRRA